MANNRMYLRCRGCGAELMLSKTFGDGWVARIDGDELQDFLSEHWSCCHGLSTETCGGVSPSDSFHFEPFELTYEGRKDWGQLKSLQQIEEEKENK